jgi:hypothetical protein
VTCKAGSERLPVRSGAAKLLVFKLSMFYAKRDARKEGARKEPHHPGCRKALSVSCKAGSKLSFFRCTLKTKL